MSNTVLSTWHAWPWHWTLLWSRYCYKLLTTGHSTNSNMASKAVRDLTPGSPHARYLRLFPTHSQRYLASTPRAVTSSQPWCSLPACLFWCSTNVPILVFLSDTITLKNCFECRTSHLKRETLPSLKEKTAPCPFTQITPMMALI